MQANRRIARVSLAAAALILAGQAGSTALAPAYPVREVLAGFAEVCRPLTTIEEAAASAKRIGWQAVVPDPASPIGKLVSFGKSEGEKLLGADGEVLPMHVFQRTVGGEQLTLVLSGVKMQGRLINGCRMYDVGETRELPVAAVEAWLKRAPNRVVDKPEIHVAKWQPGYDANHASLDLYFVPAGSPAIELVKVSGVALKADFVGESK